MQGRGGKGVIYIQAAGNGRLMGNNCAANCYINHPYAIGIASANQMGEPAASSDRCTAIIAAVYSGTRGFEGVVSMSMVMAGIDYSKPHLVLLTS